MNIGVDHRVRKTTRVQMSSDLRSNGFQIEQGEFSEPPKHTKTMKKTGTTICGVVFSSGVVLGADTRSTNGETVADKNCAKIHFLAPNIYCCGAGTAADTEAITGNR